MLVLASFTFWKIFTYIHDLLQYFIKKLPTNKQTSEPSKEQAKQNNKHQEKDRAVLELKRQRDRVKKYQEKVFCFVFASLSVYVLVY